MKRTLFVAALVVGFAATAGAATLSIVSDSPTYTVGQTITLTVTGVNTGESASAIFGRVIWTGDEAFVSNTCSGLTGAQVLVSGCATQSAHTSATVGFAYAPGALLGEDDFQTALNAGFGVTSTVNENSTSVFKLVADAAGIVDTFWRQGAQDSLGVEYFNISSYGDPVQNGENATGVTFTINAIPEPTTAALLGLGLFGLLLTGRRRS